MGISHHKPGAASRQIGGRCPPYTTSRLRHSAGSAQAGFTLAEVLVALAVLAIALAAVLGVVSQSIHTTVALRDRTQAMWLAQDRLTLHQLQHDWPGLDTTTGVTEDGGRKWFWREQVSSSPQTEMRRIEIEIRESENKEVLAHLAGYLRRY